MSLCNTKIYVYIYIYIMCVCHQCRKFDKYCIQNYRNAILIIVQNLDISQSQIV